MLKSMEKRINFYSIATILVLVLVIMGASSKVQAETGSALGEETIINGDLWYDSDGNNIQGHGGNILSYNGKYYWVGEYKQTANFSGVALYSSEDLMNWKYENMILTPETPDDDGTIGFCTIERPKLIYNGSQFVLWAHWENGSNYTESKLIVAKCDTINGDYEFVKRFNPQTTEVDTNGNLVYSTNRSLDFTIYNDDTVANQAYIISACGHDMCVYKLTDDCMDVIPEKSYKFWEDAGREAPSMVKVNDYYVLITSGQSGWYPNQSMYGYTKDISNPDAWTPADKLITIGNNSTYYSQPTNIAIIKDEAGQSQYIYMGDRWKPGDLGKSTYVWLPMDIQIDESSTNKVQIKMDYLNKWSFNTTTGSFTKPNEMIVSENKPITVSILGTNSNPASQAVDGIIDTDSTWGNNNFYGLSNSAVPFTMELDLEAVYDLSRMDLATRLCNGSETYYQYVVEGSMDGISWSNILDESSNKVVGFRSNSLTGSYRYIKMTVNGVNNVHNQNSAAWAAGVVEWQIYSYDKAPQKEVLSNLYHTYKETEKGYYTDSSYTAFTNALISAKQLLDSTNSTDEECESAVNALVTAYKGLTVSDDMPVSVEDLTTVTLQGTQPSLPQTVQVTTKGGSTVSKNVTWNTLSLENFSNPFDTVTVSGTVDDFNLNVNIEVEVIPPNLIYFIDCGTNDDGISPSHSAVMQSGLAPNLKNTNYSDPISGNTGSVWQRSVGQVRQNPESKNKYESGIGGNMSPIYYKVTLDPGTYDITVAGAAYSNVQGHTCSGVVMTATGATLENGSITAKEGESATGQLTVTSTTLVTLNMTGINNTKAGVTFIGIAKQ